MNVGKFLRTPILKNICEGQLSNNSMKDCFNKCEKYHEVREIIKKFLVTLKSKSLMLIKKNPNKKQNNNQHISYLSAQ